MKQDLKYADVTQTIIGCAMKVHRAMKNGYVEAVYQKCLAIELGKADIKFQQEVEMSIYYNEVLVGKRRLDFLIEDKIAVEIKAFSELTDAHLAQAINYLETQNLETGLLITFGSKSLQFKRIINQKKLSLKNPVHPINP